MLGGLLREGNEDPAENADNWIPHLVRRLKESTGAKVRVRNNAGFPGNDTLEALEERNIKYLGRGYPAIQAFRLWQRPTPAPTTGPPARAASGVVL